MAFRRNIVDIPPYVLLAKKEAHNELSLHVINYENHDGNCIDVAILFSMSSTNNSGDIETILISKNEDKKMNESNCDDYSIPTLEESDDEEDNTTSTLCTYISAIDEMSVISKSPSTKLTVKAIFKSKKAAPGLTPEGKLPKNYWLRRKRVWTRPIDSSKLVEGQQFQEAHFAKDTGLEGKAFSGTDGERAILVQSVENYEKLKSHSKFAKCFEDEDYMLSPTFGEHLLVEGMDNSQICIGDIFEIENKLSPLTLEVTSPCLPGAAIDKRHGTNTGIDGIREYTKVNALAGWFVRVLEEGRLNDGMTLHRTRNPHSKWSLTNISRALYGEGDSFDQTHGRASWQRNTEELIELAKVQQLANFEWKDEALCILFKKQIELKRKQEREGFINTFMNSVYNMISWEGVKKDSTTVQNQKVAGEELKNLFTIPYVADKEQIQTSPRLSMTVEGIFKKKNNRGRLYKKITHPSHKYMSRQRLQVKPLDGQEAKDEVYEKAFFIPGVGLQNGGRLWHLNQHEEHDAHDGVLEERAILWQSTDHYEKIKSDPLYGKYLENEDIMVRPSFGEQVIVTGCNSSQICIGDIFEVKGRDSSLVVEVTSPRKPCFMVDERHCSPKGLKGMKHFTMTNALAGWFTRVIVPGELRDGMELVRTRNPNPKWTLTTISRALFSEGDKIHLLTCRAHWVRSIEELIELVNLPQLGYKEWREDAESLLRKKVKESNFLESIHATKENLLHSFLGVSL